VFSYEGSVTEGVFPRVFVQARVHSRLSPFLIEWKNFDGACSSGSPDSVFFLARNNDQIGPRVGFNSFSETSPS